MVPFIGSKRPVKIFINVVFPDPVSPIIPILSSFFKSQINIVQN